MCAYDLVQKNQHPRDRSHGGAHEARRKNEHPAHVRLGSGQQVLHLALLLPARMLHVLERLLRRLLVPLQPVLEPEEAEVFEHPA